MVMYFTAVVLPADLNEEVLKLKKWAHEHWGCKVGLKSPAHITLLPPFWMDEKLENDLVQAMENLYRPMPPFEVSTANFAAFKPRTIFIDVVVDTALQSLKKTTDTYFKQQPQYGAKIDNRPFHPHITIATRDLRKSAFAEAWPQVEHKTFREKFIADGVSLLRHNGQLWQVVHTAGFDGAANLA
jgi:2'-5' RNA ligase